MAEFWAKRVVKDSAETIDQRVTGMFSRAIGRPPSDFEINRLVTLVRRSAELRQVERTAAMASVDVWKDVAHAIFNLKEFANVR